MRKKLEDAGLFKAKPWFYIAMLAHVIALELAGWAVLKYLGSSWLPYTLAVCLLVTAQVLTTLHTIALHFALFLRYCCVTVRSDAS